MCNLYTYKMTAAEMRALKLQQRMEVLLTCYLDPDAPPESIIVTKTRLNGTD
jgi:hypothetical protein